MTGHCTINRLECGYGRTYDTCTHYQCKREYTRPATEEEKVSIKLPCDKCIHNKICMARGGSNQDGVCESFDEIRPQGEWIPITTRELTDEEKENYDESVIFKWTCPIPEVGEDVLVTTAWGDVKIVTFTDGGEIGTYFDEMDEDEVVAWMPLPEPYKKGE